MDLLNLKTLVEAARQGSFTKAASKLCVTQSAVSRRVQCLEEHLGQPLLDRSGSVLRLTEAGEVVFAKARLFFELEKEILNEIQLLQKKQKISFCCTPPFGIAYLPGILKKFMASNSDSSELKFSFEMPEKAIEGLREKLFDLALIEYCEDLDLEGFTVLELPKDEMVFVSAPSMGIEKEALQIEELLAERYYCKKEGCCAKRFLDKSMKGLGLDSSRFTKALFFDDVPFIIQEVIAGEGITFISRCLVTEYLERGLLKAHHVTGFDTARSRSIIFPGRRKQGSLVQEFIREIYAAFGEACPPLS